jgi:hypothetical protein
MMGSPHVPAGALFAALHDSAELATANAVVWGATVSILTSWWGSGCAPLPLDDATLAVLARCHARRWYSVREQVRAALVELMPQISSEYTRGARIAAKRSAAASVAARARHYGPKRPAVRTASESAALTDHGPRPMMPNPQRLVGARPHGRGDGVASLISQMEKLPHLKPTGGLRDTRAKRP